MYGGCGRPPNGCVNDVGDIPGPEDACAANGGRIIDGCPTPGGAPVPPCAAVP